jgi:enoyl-CoA hydratase/carnithine racemase
MPEKHAAAYRTIRLERDRRLRGLVTITLDRPEKLNAIDAQMHDELQRACHDLKYDATSRVVIITGEGRAFSSGNDLRPKPQRPAKDDMERRLRLGAGNRTCDAIESLDQVTIAAVNGLAVGGAVVLASACDIRLAAESAWFSIPEVDLALPLTWNALPRLMRELGPARTKELVMTCDRFTALDAERWGFVNHVCADAELLREARALAKKLLAKDQMALALTKTATNALARQMVPPEATQADREMLFLADFLARRTASRRGKPPS